MRLADHAWTGIGDSSDAESLAFVPVGATEPYGPHLSGGLADHR